MRATASCTATWPDRRRSGLREGVGVSGGARRVYRCPTAGPSELRVATGTLARAAACPCAGSRAVMCGSSFRGGVAARCAGLLQPPFGFTLGLSGRGARAHSFGTAFQPVCIRGAPGRSVLVRL